MKRGYVELAKRIYSPGEEISGTVHFSLDKPVSQRSATICVTGKERTEVTYGSGEDASTAVEEHEFLHAESPLPLPIDDKGKIKSGDYSIPFRCQLPQELPETYVGGHGKILYAVWAKVDVPFWVDIKDSAEFVVASSGAKAFRSPPIDACSDTWSDPRTTGVSFALERSEYRRGEILSGKCAFRNPNSKNLREIVITLAWTEAATAKGHAATTKLMNRLAKVPLEGRVFQGETPFNVEIPQDAPPTYGSRLLNVKCILSAKLDIAWAADVAATAAIDIVGSLADKKTLPAYPAVNIQRASQPEYSATAETTCSRCGTPIKNTEAQYCPNCGSRLHP